MATFNARPHHRPRCTSHRCGEPATAILRAAHPAGLICSTLRCRRCAAQLAGRYLIRGYTIHLTRATTTPPTQPAAGTQRAAPRPRPPR